MRWRVAGIYPGTEVALQSVVSGKYLSDRNTLTSSKNDVTEKWVVQLRELSKYAEQPKVPENVTPPPVPTMAGKRAFFFHVFGVLCFCCLLSFTSFSFFALRIRSSSRLFSRFDDGRTANIARHIRANGICRFGKILGQS